MLTRGRLKNMIWPSLKNVWMPLFYRHENKAEVLCTIL